MIDPAFSLPLAWFLAVMLGFTAAHKLMRRERFLEAMDGYGLVSIALARVIAPLLAAIEGIAAICLIAPSLAVIGAALASVIFAAYAAAMSLAILRGKGGSDCGCHFGPTPSKLGWPLVARNILLIGIAGIVAMPLSQPAAWHHYLNGALAGFALVLIQESVRTALANREWIRAIKGAS